MRFELEGFAPIDDPTPELVENGLHTLDRAERAYAVLEQRPATYLRAARAGDGKYVLEVQDGATEQRYQAARPVPLEDLVAAFGAYLRHGDDWRSRFEWQAMDSTPPRRRFPSLTSGWRWGPVTADSRGQPPTRADDKVIADPDAGQAWVPLDLRLAIPVGMVLLGMAALAIFLVYGHSREVRAVGLLGALLCGVFGLMALGTGVWARGRGVRLDQEGFAIVGRLWTLRHAWADIAEFSVVQSAKGTRLVGYRLEDHVARSRLDYVSRLDWLVDVDGVVPRSTAVRPEALAATLESWRIRYQERGRGNDRPPGPAARDGDCGGETRRTPG